MLNISATYKSISATNQFRKFACCHTEKEVADQAFYLTQSQYSDIGPTSLSADPGRVASGVRVFKPLI